MGSVCCVWDAEFAVRSHILLIALCLSWHICAEPSVRSGIPSARQEFLMPKPERLFHFFLQFHQVKGPEPTWSLALQHRGGRWWCPACDPLAASRWAARRGAACSSSGATTAKGAGQDPVWARIALCVCALGAEHVLCWSPETAHPFTLQACEMPWELLCFGRESGIFV